MKRLPKVKRTIFSRPLKSLKRGFFILILPLVTLITFLLFLMIQWNEYKNIEKFLLNKLDYQIRTQSLYITNPLWNVNENRINTIFDLLIEDPDIVGISLFDENKTLYSSKGIIQGFNLDELNYWLKERSKTSTTLSLFNNHILMALGLKKIEWDYYTDSRDLYFETDGSKYLIGELFLILSDENIDIQYHKHIRYILVLCIFILTAISISLVIIYQFTTGIPLVNLKKSLINAMKEKDISEHIHNRKDLNELHFINDTFKRLWANQKDLENELINSKEYFEKTIKAAPVSMVITDSNQDIVLFNDKFIEEFGYTLKDVSTADKWWELAYPDINYRLEVKDSWQKAIILAEETNMGIEMWTAELTIKDRTKRQVEFKMTLLGDFSVIAMNDITERIKNEKEKAELQEQLNHRYKMDAIGQLAGGMAHDFNNVLNGIMSASQLLQLPQRNLDDKSLEYVDMILQASVRASDLITNLLAFSRKSKISSAPVDIHKVLDDTIMILKSTIDKKISINTSNNAKSHIVMGDKSSLQNVFINLGLNASHAISDQGFIQIESENIQIRDNDFNKESLKIKQGTYCKIEFKDSGTGISEKNLKRIFEPFFTTKEQGKGTGLGLSAVYGTIHDHNGEIQVFSELGKGTTFIIYLPCF